MANDRDRYAEILEKMFGSGTMTSADKMKLIAEYDALTATKRLPIYALLSTIVAAISAIASAAAAYFAYAALHVPH
jgi:hypothetical protein